MAKVAILYICTGRYDVFWKDFYESYEKLFLPRSLKDYFVFTDAKQLIYKDRDNVHVIFQESLGWPDNTLMRYHMFLGIREQLETYDYIYFMNANCQCMTEITEEEFLPKQDKPLIVVQHPSFYADGNEKFTYDRNPKSTAYIPMGEGKVYVCGGVNGGTAEAFLAMSEEIAKNVDIDKRNKVIALWHDESHINRYIVSHDQYIMQTPAYCYPEGKELPFEMKILIREKAKWINVEQVKLPVKTRVSNWVKDKIGKIVHIG